jgi:serine/threonine protein phosphatase 1
MDTAVWISPKRLVASSRATLPDGIRIYAVGDVHGRSDLLDHVFSQIDHDLEKHPTPRAIEVFLGDYIDRGPDSSGVLDRLVERSRLREVVCLKGNHEPHIFEFLQDPQVLHQWKQFGGYETLMSYGLKPSTKMDSSRQGQLAREFNEILPETHRQFLRTLRLSFSCGDFFFAHAGVKPGIPLNAQREQDLIWIRDEFLHCKEDHGKIIIHGHTPVREPDLRANRINIDTGAFATGRLTCLMLEGDRAAFITEGREWLYEPKQHPNDVSAAEKVLAAARTLQDIAFDAGAGRHRPEFKVGPAAVRLTAFRKRALK